MYLENSISEVIQLSNFSGYIVCSLDINKECIVFINGATNLGILSFAISRLFTSIIAINRYERFSQQGCLYFYRH
jgi:hypothetical protein